MLAEIVIAGALITDINPDLVSDVVATKTQPIFMWFIDCRQSSFISGVADVPCAYLNVGINVGLFAQLNTRKTE
ncbi:hypothetical protein BRY75_09765 [Acinetobacter baumannii]|nr:hypothetical protein BRY75_09765 [Acinetobacter baumannii]